MVKTSFREELMSSFQAITLNTYIRLNRMLYRRPASYDVVKMRAFTESSGSIFKALVPQQCEPITAKGVPCEWLVPPEVIAGRIVLYFHGGYYNAGSAHSHRVIAMNTGYAAKARVLNVDYRLAPEHPYPAALEDAAAVYVWLLAEGKPPDQNPPCGRLGRRRTGLGFAFASARTRLASAKGSDLLLAHDRSRHFWRVVHKQCTVGHHA